MSRVCKKIIDSKMTYDNIKKWEKFFICEEKKFYSECVTDFDQQSEMIIFESNLFTFKLSVIF